MRGVGLGGVAPVMLCSSHQVGGSHTLGPALTLVTAVCLRKVRLHCSVGIVHRNKGDFVWDQNSKVNQVLTSSFADRFVDVVIEVTQSTRVGVQDRSQAGEQQESEDTRRRAIHSKRLAGSCCDGSDWRRNDCKTLMMARTFQQIVVYFTTDLPTEDGTFDVVG